MHDIRKRHAILLKDQSSLIILNFSINCTIQYVPIAENLQLSVFEIYVLMNVQYSLYYPSSLTAGGLKEPF
jgi:hypothetical protein